VNGWHGGKAAQRCNTLIAPSFIGVSRPKQRRWERSYLFRVVAAISVSTALLATGCTFEYSPQSGSDKIFVDDVELSEAQSSELIREADSMIERDSGLYESGAKCRFDRWPSSMVLVACGPTRVPSPYDSRTAIGPPYFNSYQIDLSADEPTEPVLTKPAILSMASLPSDFWRPDGTTLRP